MTSKICENCSKEVRPEKRGSMTQWVFDDSRCSCQKSELKVPSEKNKNNICPKCFNFKESRRSGSMTQWIFRRYQCKCPDGSMVQNENSQSEPVSSISTSDGEPSAEEDFGATELPFNIQRYKPLKFIARSTNSVVYKCFDRQLQRTVAIKTLTFVDSAALISFQQEARATGHLKHPNIVEVLDFGIGDGAAAYMILEYVDAINLDDWINNNGPFNETDAIEVFAAVCRALDFAHRKGIFHRDLKPQNILIRSTGEVKLIDFGLALVVNPEKNISDTKGLSLAGTPSYMSPDQFLGRPYDVRSEIYSLGCVLFVCLTGRPPFYGETALEIAGEHAHAPVPTLAETNPDKQFSNRLQHAISRCLEKDPDLRYSSISALATDLKVELHQQEQTDTKMSGSIFISNDGMQPILDHPRKTIFQRSKSVIAKNALPIFISVFAIAVLTAGAAVLIFSREQKTEQFPELQSSMFNMPTEQDPIIRQNNARGISTLENKVDVQLDRYFGKKDDSASLLSEADQSRSGENPSTDNLYLALENYNEAIRRRSKDGPPKPPDAIITRALIGIYLVNLKLRQYAKLADLETKILKYCPENSDIAAIAHTEFENAAVIYSKRKKTDESLRCMFASLAAWKKLHAKDGLPETGLEINIGSTLLDIGDWQNAKQWLEIALAHVESSPSPNQEWRVACLIRLGAAYQRLGDYKTANQRLRTAEKLIQKASDKIKAMYIGQLYYRWAIVLQSEGKLDEAEGKLRKGINAERDGRSRLAMESFLGTLRKQQQARSAGKGQ